MIATHPKRSDNNKYQLKKDGLLHQMDKLNEKIKALPIKTKEHGRRKVSNK